MTESVIFLALSSEKEVRERLCENSNKFLLDFIRVDGGKVSKEDMV